MARRNMEFRPDPQRIGVLSKLYLTPSQRRAITKWFLYSAVCVLSLVIQASVVGRYRIFGGKPDLFPAAVAMICVAEGAEEGSTFALAASLVYVFSGMSPGYFAVAVLTICCSLLTLFRDSYLRRSFSALWLCGALAAVCYEMSIFGIGLLLEYTTAARLHTFLVTSALSAAVMPLYYPLLRWIAALGGNPWKE